MAGPMTLGLRGAGARGVWTLGLSLGGIACLAALVAAEIWTHPERRAAYTVGFTPGGDRVAAVGEGENKVTGWLWAWDLTTGRQTMSAQVLDRPLSLAFAPDGKVIATGGWRGTVTLWDSATGRILRTYSGHSTPVRGLAFMPDGRTLAAGASDGRVILWEVASGREKMRLDRGRRFPVNGMAISHDGQFLAAAGGFGPGAVSVWDLETGQPLAPASGVGGREPIAFAPDRTVLAVAATSPAGSVGLIDLDSDRGLSQIPAVGARSLAFSPDSRLVATGGDDEAVTVWEAETGRSVAIFDGHRHRPDPLGDRFRNLMAPIGLAEHRVQNSVWSVAFSPDGTRLASAGQDGTVWLWSLPGRDPKRTPHRALLPRPGRPAWMPIFRVTLTLLALTLFALASRRKKGQVAGHCRTGNDSIQPRSSWS